MASNSKYKSAAISKSVGDLCRLELIAESDLAMLLRQEAKGRPKPPHKKPRPLGYSSFSPSTFPVFRLMRWTRVRAKHSID